MAAVELSVKKSFSKIDSKMNIIPLKNAFPQYIDRLLIGPIDVLCDNSYSSGCLSSWHDGEQRRGFDPKFLAENSSQYFLLEDTSQKGKIVGFCSAFNDTISPNSIVLNEFEIFHEYRGEKWGKKFANYIWDNLESIVTNEPIGGFLSDCKQTKKKRKELIEILSPAIGFWWRTLGGTYFVQHIADVIDAQSVDDSPFRKTKNSCEQNNKKERFTSWLRNYKHDKQERTTQIFTEIFNELCKKPRTKIVDICDKIKNEFKL
jgi:hypothetical protein